VYARTRDGSRQYKLAVTLKPEQALRVARPRFASFGVPPGHEEGSCSLNELSIAIALWLFAGFAVATDFSRQSVGSAPVYLFRDSAGNAYALELPEPTDATLAKHYVTPRELAALTDLGATIAYLPEHPDSAIGPCTSSAFPHDFNIAFVEGAVFGNIARCDPGG